MTDQQAQPAADPRIGTRVGSYRIDCWLGAGGMGTVYAATAEDGARVALKIVNEDLLQNEVALERFRLEAEIASTIRSPHLVSVLDTGVHDGVPYLAQEFIDGSSLEQTLDDVGRLDVQTTIRICADVVQGLQALWEAGMVHRDVTPGNILLDRAGTAYLTDFGLAKNTKGSVLTLPGQTLGSLAYMAPEQIRCDSVTGAADIYSLGCVMFECLAGHPPFGDRSGIRLLWAHLSDEPPDPTPPGEDLRPEFVQALKTALRKDPDERPQCGRQYVALLAETSGRLEVNAAS
jgi:serine/threonine-protein kinase